MTFSFLFFFEMLILPVVSLKNKLKGKKCCIFYCWPVIKYKELFHLFLLILHLAFLHFKTFSRCTDSFFFFLLIYFFMKMFEKKNFLFINFLQFLFFNLRCQFQKVVDTNKIICPVYLFIYSWYFEYLKLML